MASCERCLLTPIMDMVVRLDPASVLDLGVGHGKWGMLCREYLDVWRNRYWPSEWKARIDGVEAFKKFRNAAHRYFYTRVYYADVRGLLPKLGVYDLVLAIAFIEHFYKVEAEVLIKDMQAHARKGVIVATRPGFLEQGAVFGNQYEVHHSGWSREDLERLGGRMFFENKLELAAIFKGKGR